MRPSVETHLDVNVMASLRGRPHSQRRLLYSCFSIGVHPIVGLKRLLGKNEGSNPSIRENTCHLCHVLLARNMYILFFKL